MWRASFHYLLIGAIFWFVGALFSGGTQGFVARSEPAQLIVLQIDTQRDDDGDTQYRPVFGLDTAAQPRPESAGNIWMRPAPHVLGEKVAGRYDPKSGEMRSDHMMERTIWLGRLAQVLGILAILQGVLMFFGVPEVLMPLRVRPGR